MADEIGVLELTIEDNAGQAGEGLGKLAGAILDVKKAIGRGLGLSTVSDQVVRLASTINTAVGTSSAMKSLTNLFTAISNFSKAEKFNIDTKRLNDIKEAFSGFSIGTSGTQMKSLQNALNGDWNADNAVDGMSKIIQMGNDIKSSGTADSLNTIAKAMKNYTAAYKDLPKSSDKIASIVQTLGIGNVAKSTSEALKTNIRPGAVMKLNPQQFGGGVEKEQIEGLVHVKSVVQQSTEKMHEFAETIPKVENSVQDIKLDDFLAVPLASLKDRFMFAGSASEEFRDKIASSIPTLKEYRDVVLGITGSRREVAMFGKKTNSQLLGYSEEAKDATSSIETLTKAEETHAEAFNKVAAASEDMAKIENTIKNIVSFSEAWKGMSGDEKGQLMEVFKKDPLVTGVLEKLSTLKGSSFDQFVTEIQRITSQSIEATEKVQQLYDLLNNFNADTGKADATGKNIPQAEAARNVVDAVGGSKAKNSVSALDAIEASMSKAGEATKKASDTMNDFKASLSAAGKAVSKLGISKLIGQFVRIAKYRMLRAIIRQITKGVTEGLSNFKKYSESIGSEYYNNMQNLSAQMTTMKNSIGAAIAPAIQAAIPIINTLTNAAIQAFNWVNQLISLLSGKNSWTRATAVTADSLNDVKDAANGAGGAVKDMLADFDELNVLDHSGGGGGGGSGTEDLSQYENMFEEVFQFDQGIKDTIKWIEDHLPIVTGLVATLGSMLMGLPTSISIGIGFVVTGLTLGYNAGYDAGKNGFTIENIAGMVLGALSSALGGALIGFKLGGPAGAIIGLILGVSIEVGVTIWGFERGRIDKLYGDISATREEVQAYIDENYKFTVNPIVEVHQAKIVDVNNYKRLMTQDISELTLAGVRAEMANYDPESVNTLTTAVNKLVQDTQSYINTSNDLQLTINATINGDVTVEALKASEGWKALDSAIQELGKELGYQLSLSATAEFRPDMVRELQDALVDITSSMENARVAEQYRRGSYDMRKAFRSGEFNQETFGYYLEGITAQNMDVYNKAVDAVNMTMEEYQAEIAGLEAMKRHYGGNYITETGQTVDELIDAATAEYNDYVTNYDSKVNDLYRTYRNEAEVMLQRADALEAMQSVLNRLDSGTAYQKMDAAFVGGLLFNREAILSAGVEQLNDIFLDMVSMASDIDKETLINASEVFGFTGWDLLTDDMKRQFFEVMKTHRVDLDEAMQLLKENYQLDIGDIVNIYGYDDLSKEVVTAMMDVYGRDEVLKYASEAGTEAYGAFMSALIGEPVIAGIHAGISPNENWAVFKLSEMAKDLENFGFPTMEISLNQDLSGEIQRILKTTYKNVDNVLKKWNFNVPGLSLTDLYMSGEDMEYLIQEFGEDVGIIVSNWQLIVPNIDADNPKASIQSLKQLLYISGNSVAGVINAWELVAPTINTNNTEQSASGLTMFLNQNEATWQMIISQPFVTGNATTPQNFGKDALGNADIFHRDMQSKVGSPLTTANPKIPEGFGADVLTSINTLYNNMKKSVADPIMIKVGIQVEQAVVNAALSGIGNIGKLILSKEQFYASGAYDIPAGDLFVANEAGPELVGSMNGKTTVANQDQIIAGITQGVAEGQADQNALLREQNALLRQILQKENSVRIGASAALGRTVKQSVEMYEMVGG